MFSVVEVEDIVKNFIRTQEDIGKRSGGSGHSGYINFSLEMVSEPRQITFEGEKCWEIEFVYILVVETEFTYYPDNPPSEYSYQQTITITDDKKIVHTSEKEGGLITRLDEFDLLEGWDD